MHSSILSQIMNAVYNWIVNFQYNWDSDYFTIGDYIAFCCIVFCIAYFVYHIVFFLFRYFERTWLGE